MFYVLIAVAVIAAVAIVYLVTTEGHYEVRRSLGMKVNRRAVFERIRDFTTWRDWSPWLLHEPEARLAFSDDPTQEGGWYTWAGKRIGAGKLTHVKIDEPRLIEDRIEFFRPFKSAAKVVWQLDEKHNETEVTWSLQGSLPFFLRPMKPMITGMIAKDYDLGLVMLRGRMDPAAERLEIQFVGDVRLEPRSALTIPFAGGMEDMIKAMQQGFPRLAGYVEQSGGTMTGAPFSAYHKVNPKTMYFECDMALPVGGEVPAGEFTRKTLGGGKYFQVKVKGSYDFLELAWYSAMAHIRMLGHKFDKSRPSLEVYENDPISTARSNDLETTLCIPVR